MKLFALLAGVSLWCSADADAQLTRDPERLYPGFFEEVQSNGVFSDQKTFASSRFWRELTP
jgi:hypothetical protein